jgi:hypothetical protein
LQAIARRTHVFKGHRIQHVRPILADWNEPCIRVTDLAMGVRDQVADESVEMTTEAEE